MYKEDFVLIVLPEPFHVFKSLNMTLVLSLLCTLQVWPGGFVDGGSPATATAEY